MRRPIILLDVDGPLTRGFFVEACKILRALGYNNAWPEKISDWNLFRGFGVPSAVEEVVRQVLRRPGVAASFNPRAGAEDFLHDLRAWADVYACTAPFDGSPTWAAEREEWLCDLLAFERREVISCRDKRRVHGDAFCDDKPAHLVEWADEWKSGIPIMWTESYNVNDPWKQLRASNYPELTARLEVLRALRRTQ